ncbi:HK97 family phage prohead protease [Luteimonas pelagia]
MRFELKRAVVEQGTFKGLASTWQRDRHGDVIERGAFAKSLAEWTARGARVPILWQHDQAEPIGALRTAAETDEGLEVEGELVLALSNAKRAHALAKSGALGMSIGFTVPEGGTETRSGVRFIREIDLAEVSLVSVPANPGAVVREVKSARDCNTIREYEALVREALGLGARDAKAVAAKSWPVLHREDAGQRREDAPDAETVSKARQLLGLT